MALKIIDNDADLTPFMMLNYNSATGADVKEKAEKQIITELETGNYVITNKPPTLISALGAISKTDSDKIRLIHDCSRPTENSLNSHNTGNETFKFQPMNNALNHIKTGRFLAKVDIRKAYRHIPVHSSNYQATGLSWEFKLREHLEFEFAYLYDTKLPKIFHRISQAITRITKRIYSDNVF